MAPYYYRNDKGTISVVDGPEGQTLYRQKANGTIYKVVDRDPHDIDLMIRANAAGTGKYRATIDELRDMQAAIARKAGQAPVPGGQFGQAAAHVTGGAAFAFSAPILGAAGLTKLNALKTSIISTPISVRSISVARRQALSLANKVKKVLRAATTGTVKAGKNNLALAAMMTLAAQKGGEAVDAVTDKFREYRESYSGSYVQAAAGWITDPVGQGLMLNLRDNLMEMVIEVENAYIAAQDEQHQFKEEYVGQQATLKAGYESAKAAEEAAKAAAESAGDTAPEETRRRNY